MMITGVVWFGRDLDWSGAAFPTRVADLSQNLFLALVAHQVIVFPWGVARSALERGLVRTAYAIALGGYLLSQAVLALNTPLSVFAIVPLLVIAFVVVERGRSAAPAPRRALDPVLWAGPPVLFVASVSIMRDYLDVSLSATGDAVLDWAQLVYATIPLAFLAGVLRTQLRRAGVGGLLVELGGAAGGSSRNVRDALAGALGDPTLELVFWLPRRERYVDLDGRVADPVPTASRAGTCLERHGERLAALVYDASLLEDPELVRAAGAAAGLALDNARLATELRTQLERVVAADAGAAGPPALDGPLAELTPRELEVLALLAEGRTDRGIAEQLHVTPKTVETHVRNIFRKLDLPAKATDNRRVHAVLTFLRERERAPT